MIPPPPAHDEHGASCYDCDRPYGDEHGFPDLIIPYRVWKQITPTQDDGGLLCPSCICKRLHERGLSCEGAFMSGPIDSVSRATMDTMRRVENIELAIEGRDNRWAGVRELVTGKPTQIRLATACKGCGAADPTIELRDRRWVCILCGAENESPWHFVERSGG